MATPTAEAIPATTPAASPQPNQYQLHGRAVMVSYYPDGFGPPSPKGPLRLAYRDNVQSLAFHGDEVRVAAVPDLGTVVSVTIVPSVDTGDTTFSLVIPDVALSQAGTLVPIRTFGVMTMHHEFVGASGHPQRETYTVMTLTGTSASGVLPA